MIRVDHLLRINQGLVFVDEYVFCNEFQIKKMSIHLLLLIQSDQTMQSTIKNKETKKVLKYHCLRSELL